MECESQRCVLCCDSRSAVAFSSDFGKAASSLGPLGITKREPRAGSSVTGFELGVSCKQGIRFSSEGSPCQEHRTSGVITVVIRYDKDVVFDMTAQITV
ncbi:hypothetical protein TREES_T100009132 [Tupaia chinensis]|uniref:Uncharacterized protein n=1 Tax=Tupaia chinensis TaxID=246437 RepID=L9KKV6_TUPCH|nr:hypothetical protein TREES_T100009132 [Tupaia chinensis]